jgi:hypothetical protein
LQRAAVLRKQLALVPARHAFGSSSKSSNCFKDVGGRTEAADERPPPHN